MVGYGEHLWAGLQVDPGKGWVIIFGISLLIIH